MRILLSHTIGHILYFLKLMLIEVQIAALKSRTGLQGCLQSRQRIVNAPSSAALAFLSHEQNISCTAVWTPHNSFKLLRIIYGNILYDKIPITVCRTNNDGVRVSSYKLAGSYPCHGNIRFLHGNCPPGTRGKRRRCIGFLSCKFT